jgi:hypothetical protein
VTSKEVPAAVLQVFNQTYPGATIKEYAEEIEDGQKFNEVSCEFEGRKIDAIYQPNRIIAEIKEVIAVEKLPENIQQAIAREFQQFSQYSAERMEKEGKIFFEVKLLDTKNQKNGVQFSYSEKLMEKEEIRNRKMEGKE